jgi:hypothetical protein
VSSRVILICAALFVALTAVEPASAHPAGATDARAVSAPSAQSRPPEPPALAPASRGPRAATIFLLILILGGLRLAVRRQYAAWVVALSLLLIFSGVEGAVHSVHHLDDTTAHCRVASSAEHVSVIEIDAPRIGVPSNVTINAPSLERPADVRRIDLPPDAGRAPPV